MADYKVTDTQLTNIANAIRTKGGTSEQLEFPTEFISAVNAISGVTAADEGKVVSNGVLVAQQSGSATANGTVDTTLINSLSVNVPQTVVMPISLTVTPPTKAEYEVDDTLDLTGIAVVANYSDGTTAVVTGSCSFSPDDGDTLDTSGDVTITATYTGTGSVSGGSYSVQLTGTTNVHVTAAPVEIVSWANGTDEQITAMIQAAHRGDIDLQTDGGWAVGDKRSITIGAFTAGGKSHAQQTIDIVITSFDDYGSCGCVLQFDFVQTLSNALRIHTGSMHRWATCEMNTTTLPALIDALPTWLQNSLIEFSVLASNSGTVETVQNKLSLRSAVELFGTPTPGGSGQAYSGEGSQIAYYSSSSKRVKPRGKNGSANAYWTRSGNKVSSGTFCAVYTNGAELTYDSADYSDSHSVAPFGCL
jgi:hypothetical protein